MVIIENLTKIYGTQTVLDIPKLDITENEFIGLVGNNGAGKSTLFKLMLDLIAANSGSISIDNHKVAQSEEWKETTAAYLDNSFLLEYLTPTEYFETIAVMSNISKEDLEAEINKYRRYLGEDNLSNKKYIRNLSAGNQQKIGIVGAMISSPKLLILDEPFNYLDPSSQESTKLLLNKYRTEKQATIIVSSHNLEHVLTISTRVLLLENGKIKKDLSDAPEVLYREIHQYFNDNMELEEDITRMDIPDIPENNQN